MRGGGRRKKSYSGRDDDDNDGGGDGLRGWGGVELFQYLARSGV